MKILELITLVIIFFSCSNDKGTTNQNEQSSSNDTVRTYFDNGQMKTEKVASSTKTIYTNEFDSLGNLIAYDRAIDIISLEFTDTSFSLDFTVLGKNHLGRDTMLVVVVKPFPTIGEIKNITWMLTPNKDNMFTYETTYNQSYDEFLIIISINEINYKAAMNNASEEEIMALKMPDKIFKLTPKSNSIELVSKGLW